MLERLQATDFAPTQGLKYVDTFELHPLFDKIAYRANVILSGPKGIAKTLSVASWAAKHNVPLITFDCSEDVRRSHLIGMLTLRGDETPFVLGPIPTAFEIANEIGTCILCFEELNALVPQMQKVLNPITDFRRKIEVPECRRVFRLDPEAKLWVVGTMNTCVYGGIYELNEDCKSRFRMIPLDYPSKGEETGIVNQVLTGLDKKITQSVLTLAHETRQKSLAFSLSTRDIIQILEDIDLCGLELALWMASGKFEGADRDYYKTRVASIFGLNIR